MCYSYRLGRLSVVGHSWGITCSRTVRDNMMSDLDFILLNPPFTSSGFKPNNRDSIFAILFSKFPICYRPQNPKSGSSGDDDIRKELSLVGDNGPARHKVAPSCVRSRERSVRRAVCTYEPDSVRPVDPEMVHPDANFPCYQYLLNTL